MLLFIWGNAADPPVEGVCFKIFHYTSSNEIKSNHPCPLENLLSVLSKQDNVLANTYAEVNVSN